MGSLTFSLLKWLESAEIMVRFLNLIKISFIVSREKFFYFKNIYSKHLQFLLMYYDRIMKTQKVSKWQVVILIN